MSRCKCLPGGSAPSDTPQNRLASSKKGRKKQRAASREPETGVRRPPNWLAKGYPRARILTTPLTSVTCALGSPSCAFLKIRCAPTIPGSGGVRDIMSLRGDNGGLQRNRWPDRAHGRRGTYDLRRNNPRPCPGLTPNTPTVSQPSLSCPCDALFTWAVMRHRVATALRACNAGYTNGARARARARMHRHSYGCRRADGRRRKGGTPKWA